MPRKAPTQITTKNAIKKAKLVELWGTTKGHITDMCRSVGIQRNTFYSWLKKDKEFNQAIQNAEWDLHDDVRDALVQKIASGSSPDIRYYLSKRHPDFKDKQGGTNISADKMILNILDYDGRQI